MVNRAKILDIIRQGKYSTTQAKIMCKDANKNLKDIISIAKANWTYPLAERIHEMARNPKDSWKAVNTLKEWMQGHHKSPDIMRFIKEDGSFVGTDEEVVEILAKHFHKVYNSNVEIEWSVLDYLKQKPILSDMNLPLSLYKFKQAIRKLILHKAPASNRVSPNAIKALNEKNRMFLFKICYDYFENIQEIEEWQKGCLKILPKKGNLSDPNNLRVINLLDVVSKVMSLVITSHLQHILELKFTPIQFGASSKTDCPEESFSIKHFLQIHK